MEYCCERRAVVRPDAINELGSTSARVVPGTSQFNAKIKHQILGYSQQASTSASSPASSSGILMHQTQHRPCSGSRSCAAG